MLEEGAQIVEDPNQPIPMKMIGHVTSSYWSENCGRSIACAGCRRTRPHGRNALRADAGKALSRWRCPAWYSSTRREDASMADAAITPASRRPLSPASCALGVRIACRPGPAHARARRPLPSRRCQGAEDRPAADAENLVVDHSSRSAVARPRWWLVIDDGRQDPLADCARVTALHSAVGISHRNVAISVSGTAAARHLLAGRRLFRSRPFRLRLSRTIWQDRDRAAAHRRACQVECWRSFSDYAYAFLSEAARDASA